MAINDSTKTDLLFKKVMYGVADTSTQKAPNEENITSPYAILSTQVWQEADAIPAGARAVARIVESHVDGNGAFLIRDPTVTTGTTWLVVRNLTDGPIASNRLRDFIPFTVDPSYEVRVYSQENQGGRLLPGTPDKEWIFDYAAGVLYFPSGIPTDAGNPPHMFITGYRYIGKKGVGASGNTGGAPTVSNITFITNSLGYDQFQNFTLDTGTMFVLQKIEVDGPCRIECHTTSSYNDTNPYIFVATDSHRVDDGSYTSNGQTYYGPRFITLMNLESPSSGKSFWKVTQASTGPAKPITIKVAAVPQ